MEHCRQIGQRIMRGMLGDLDIFPVLSWAVPNYARLRVLGRRVVSKQGLYVPNVVRVFSDGAVR